MYRIGLVSEACGGGIGKHVLDLAEGLAALGHGVLLLYSPSRPDHGFQERIERSRDHGYTAVPIDMVREPGLADLRALWALRRSIREYGRLDILHGHSSKGGALARMARRGLARAVVYTPNAWYTMNPELGSLARLAYGTIERSLAHLTERIIVTSRAEYEHACALGITSRKLVEIPNGIQPWPWSLVTEARRAIRNRLGIAEQAIVVGFLGRLVRQKAPDLAVRVFAELRRERKDLVLIMAGNGEEAERTRALARQLAVDSQIVWISSALGHEIIPAFDIFLMTSRYEGFPYTLLEALNCGCAIVTTPVGGAHACVRDGVNGYVVDDTTASSLAAATIRLADMMGGREEMRAAARTIVEEFSCERMVQRTLEVYRASLAG